MPRLRRFRPGRKISALSATVLSARLTCLPLSLRFVASGEPDPSGVLPTLLAQRAVRQAGNADGGAAMTTAKKCDPSFSGGYPPSRSNAGLTSIRL